MVFKFGVTTIIFDTCLTVNFSVNNDNFFIRARKFKKGETINIDKVVVNKAYEITEPH